jgi:hypothetical protein
MDSAKRDREPKRIAGGNRRAETPSVEAGQHRQSVPKRGLAQHRYRADLGGGLDNEHAGHDGEVREVPGE